VLPFREILAKNESLPTKELARPSRARPLRVRPVPPPAPRPGFHSHARLRRASPITQYAAAAALEALGEDAPEVSHGRLRLGIVLCVMAGCVSYTRRFFEEILENPLTASPLVFPETVFNAPASHIAALLGTMAINYTLVGDPGMFLHALALAADWLSSMRVDGCLVIGAEELDWLSAEAFLRFERKAVMGEGAGAVYLRRNSGLPSIRLSAISSAHTFSQTLSRTTAAQAMRSELSLGSPDHLLCEGTQRLARLDAAELAAWQDWSGSRLAPKTMLGEGLAAASAWQCAAALDALRLGQCRAATVSIVGVNQQAIGAEFVV
jgi:3-oxoacyl-(acyl-carrier-protein) synthase